MSEADKTIRFTVSLPESLLADLDRRFVSQGYASRSELVRDLIRRQLVQEQWDDDQGEVAGVLTICYDHHQRELGDKLAAIQHNKFVNIFCVTHVHVDHHNCLEAIILRGKPSEIEKMALQIAGLRGVRFAELTRTALTHGAAS